MTARATSPEDLREHQREAFLRRFRLGCLCSPFELRQEHAGLECARCGSPLVRIVPVAE